jgi:hypothetical protein
MARLPVPGQDNGVWGDILNAFLSVEHNTDGTLKASGTISSKADNATTVHTSGAETIAGTKTFLAPPVVPTPTSSTHATTKAYVDSAVLTKATDTSVVHLAGAETITGVKTFSGVPVIATITNTGTLTLPTTTDTLVGRATTDTLSNKTLQSPIIRGTVVVALTDAATITTDASLGNTFTVTLGGNRTIANPTNPIAGQKIIYSLTQDATGSRTVTWGAAFRFGTDIPVPTLTTTAAKTDHIGFLYNAASSTWDCVALARGL